MTIKQCSSIGNAVQFVLKQNPSLKWDKHLEDMHASLYIPSSIPSESPYKKKSLGQLTQAYMKHYELGENFFPFEIEVKKGISKKDYLACLLNYYHDSFHVLGSYEASDEDEMRLESFLLGYTPLAFSVFFQTCFKNPEINTAKYKHLRDVWAAPVYWEDYERGRKVEGLISFKIEDVLDIPVERLRKKMKIAPRVEFYDPKNTCGIRNQTPFFA